MSLDDINSMAQQVHDLCGRRLSDIRVDLLKTRNAEATINRIFDGTFLEGTVRDASLKAHIILDSDDEEVYANDQHCLTSTAMVERSASQWRKPIHTSPTRDILAFSSEGAVPLPSRSEDEDSRRQRSSSCSPPLNDPGNVIPLLLTGPHSVLPTQTGSQHEHSPVTFSSSYPPGELSVSLSPPGSGTARRPVAVATLSSPSQFPRHLSISSSHLVSTTAPDSEASHRLNSPEYLSLTASAPQGTSVFDPIAIDDERDDIKEDDHTIIDSVPNHLHSAPVKTTTGERQAKRTLLDDVLAGPAASSLPLDFLKDWEYSSDDDEKDNKIIGKPLAVEEPRKKSDENEQQSFKSRQRKVEQEAKRHKKEELKERQQQEKQARQRRKEELKAEKEKKKLLEQANRVRSNRQELYSEMILDIDREFYTSPRGELLRQVMIPKEAELRQVETMYYTIAWHRKTRAAWDEKQGTFIPYSDNQIRIVQESKILVFMDTAELCEIIQAPDRDNRIDRIKRACGGRQLLLMVEGLDAYYKRKSLLQQRSFEQSVIHNLSGGGSLPNYSNKRAKRKRDALTVMAEAGPTRNEVEAALTSFQLVKDIMIVPTTDEADSIDWIVALTADIANAIYKDRIRHLKQSSSRCGKDATETWNKMLQEIQLCTPPVANAIAAAYPNAQYLHLAYNQVINRRDRDELLADIEVDRGILASRGRTVNNYMSKKICTIFTSDDPSLYIA